MSDEAAKDNKYDDDSGHVPESELEQLADGDDTSGGTTPGIAASVTAAASAAYASLQTVCPTGSCTGDCAGRG